MIGSSYRVVVREPGKEPIISDWIEITDRPVTARSAGTAGAAFGHGPGDRPARETRCQRRGLPIGQWAGSNSVRTDADGRFELKEFPGADGVPVCTRRRIPVPRPGAQAGRSAKISGRRSRADERPERELRKLADPIPLDESRAMARRIMERWWKAAVAKGDENAKYFVVEFLTPADPVGALQKIAAIKFPTEQSRARLQSLAARALARTDFDEGETVAESIADPGIRAGTLAHLADMLPASEKPRKLAILERAPDPGQGGDHAVRLRLRDGRSGGAAARAGRDGKGQGALRPGSRSGKARRGRRPSSEGRSPRSWRELTCRGRWSWPSTLATDPTER